MAYSQDDLDAIQGAIARGVRTAMIQGEMVTYHSLEEMERIERKIKRALGSDATARPRLHYPSTGSGYR